ncbi:MAG: hypothetical protein AAGA96_13745 [Verrucomicrobiota bacterium]
MTTLHFDYRQEGWGRSGHALKDLFTSCILAELMEGHATFNESWRDQAIVPWEHIATLLSAPLSDYDKVIIHRPEKHHWHGISFEAFTEFRDSLFKCLGRSNRVQVRISGVFRIHLYQVHNWEHRGWIPPGSFNRLQTLWRQLCLGTRMMKRAFWPPQAIAIHARRGDVANPSHDQFSKMGPGGVWSGRFYQDLVEALLEEFPESAVTVYSERIGSDDLSGISQARLELGGEEETRSHFLKMAEADLLIPASSSLSTWAAYATKGQVWIYHRDQLKQFDFDPLPKNMIFQ